MYLLEKRVAQWAQHHCEQLGLFLSQEELKIFEDIYLHKENIVFHAR